MNGWAGSMDVCTNTEVQDIDKCTDFHFCCMASVLINTKTSYISVLLLVTKSYSIVREDIFDLLFAMILHKLFN